MGIFDGFGMNLKLFYLFFLRNCFVGLLLKNFGFNSSFINLEFSDNVLMGDLGLFLVFFELL